MNKRVLLFRKLRPGSWRSTQVRLSGRTHPSQFSLSLPLGELCVFYELGWLDDAGNFNNVTAEADIITLPSDVTIAVSEESMDYCMSEVLQKMSEDEMVRECVESDKYTEEELSQLQDFAEATAGIQCFLELFQQGCNKFVGGQIYTALSATTFNG